MLSFAAPKQLSKSKVLHYQNEALAFDYPAAWKLTNNSTSSQQHVTVASEGGSVEITLLVQPLTIVESCDLRAKSTQITNGLLKKVSQQVGAPRPLQTFPIKTVLGQEEVEGIQLHGRIRGKPVSVDVYSTRFRLHAINVLYLRMDSDKNAADGWYTVRTSLKANPATVVGAAKPTDKPEPGASQLITSGPELTGRAYKLVQPLYPRLAKMAHASGTVVVQVLIDENGDVIAAHAIAGHPLLQPAAVAAARASKFSITKLCSEPVQVNGVIHYNFLAQ